MNKINDDLYKKICNLKSTDEMLEILNKYGHSEKEYLPSKIIIAKNKMDKDYQYTLTAQYGDVYTNKFQPYFTPQDMLWYGVFEGHYLNDCILEFPKEWFIKAIENKTLNPVKPDINCNYFKIKSRMPLSHWEEKEWIYGDDNRGWFQWYCRYFIGRRDPKIDNKQIKRYNQFKRHYGQVRKNCDSIDCRPKQRQALLQWGYNAFVASELDMDD